ncbi:MAG: hypothetical protein NT120_01260, partial [Candidatus Aenigmarchaeota archaeon]|nr:hypothetical protein [Candidatus Aenigmarchaeota archaeon]
MDPSSEQPMFVLKPHMIAAMFSRFLTTVFIFIIIGFWLGSLLFVFGGILGLAVFDILFLVALFFSYLNLRARDYRFFNDRVE